MSPASIALLVLRTIAFLLGLTGNMFILAVNFIGWIKRSSDLNYCDLIICCLTLSHLAHLVVYFLVITNDILPQAIYPLGNGLEMLHFTLMFIRYCNLWFVTWFCVYCVAKVVTFTHPLLVGLTLRFLENVPWLLLASMIISLFISLPAALSSKVQPAPYNVWNTSIASMSNASSNNLTYIMAFWSFTKAQYTAYIISTAVVLAVFLSSGVGIIIVLCRHVERMRQNQDSLRNDAHVDAVKTVAFLLVLYSAIHLINFLRFVKVCSIESPMVFVVILMIDFCPALNSFILILRIPKLRTSLSMICSLSTCSGRVGT